MAFLSFMVISKLLFRYTMKLFFTSGHVNNLQYVGYLFKDMTRGHDISVSLIYIIYLLMSFSYQKKVHRINHEIIPVCSCHLKGI